MKHSITELTKVEGIGVTVKTSDSQKSLLWRVCNYKQNNGSFKYIDNGMEKIAWQFGEKTWFDTQAERDAYRAENNKAYDELVARNKVIKQITERLAEKNIDELLDILTTM